MAKKMSAGMLNFLITAGTGLIRIMGRSWRYRILTKSPQQKVIFAFWHRDILPLMYLQRNKNFAVLISQSQDGDIVAGASEKLGYITVRGSSKRGGGKATREMVKLSKNRSIGITPDGPKGPAKEFKEGIVFIAKVTKLPVVLVSVDINREKVFNSWDRFRLPLPFSRIVVKYSDQIFIDRSMSNEDALNLLKNEMNKLEQDLK